MNKSANNKWRPFLKWQLFSPGPDCFEQLFYLSFHFYNLYSTDNDKQSASELHNGTFIDCVLTLGVRHWQAQIDREFTDTQKAINSPNHGWIGKWILKTKKKLQNRLYKLTPRAFSICAFSSGRVYINKRPEYLTKWQYLFFSWNEFAQKASSFWGEVQNASVLLLFSVGCWNSLFWRFMGVAGR